MFFLLTKFPRQTLTSDEMKTTEGKLIWSNWILYYSNLQPLKTQKDFPTQNWRLGCRFSPASVWGLGPAPPVCGAQDWGLSWVQHIKHPMLCWESPPVGNKDTYIKTDLFFIFSWPPFLLLPTQPCYFPDYWKLGYLTSWSFAVTLRQKQMICFSMNVCTSTRDKNAGF